MAVSTLLIARVGALFNTLRDPKDVHSFAPSEIRHCEKSSITLLIGILRTKKYDLNISKIIDDFFTSLVRTNSINIVVSRIDSHDFLKPRVQQYSLNFNNFLKIVKIII